MTHRKLKKISNINDEFDLKLFLYITRKNILYLVIFLILALGGAFLYLRYTPPVYQTSSVIQISGEEQTQRILPEITTAFFDDDIAKQIELMRSQTFMKRALEKLPLEKSYYSKGRFLNFELYKNSPFTVNTNVKCSSIYGVPVFVEFIDKENVIISYGNDANLKEKEVVIGNIVTFPEVELSIDINNFDVIEEQQSLFSKNSFFFVINNPENIVKKYANKIEINLLNAAAKTIQITIEDNNPRKAADIVNSMAEEFGVYELEKKTESANKVLNFIDNQLDLAFDQLTESEVELENFKNDHEIDESASSPLRSMEDRLNEFENRLIQLDIEENIYKKIENSLKEEEQTDVYELVAILSGSEFSGNISGMLSKLQELLLEREKLLYEVTPSSRQVESLDHQIEIQKNMIIESMASLKRNIGSRREEIMERIAQYEQSMLDQQVEYSMIEYSRLQRVHSINERFYNQLLEKKAQHSISKAGFVTQSVILEESQTPSNPISPKPQNIYFSSLLAAFFLGAGVIMLRYIFYNQISSLNDITKHTNASVLGIIPKYRKEVPPTQLLVLRKPKSLISEALRSIRTNLQFINNDPGSKLIAVTSTISGEGKTFFAINLAGILAYSDKKVIVIDLDMRKPKIHQGFEVDNAKGISTILSGIDDISKCIQPSKVNNLDFITAGPVPPNPSELILNKNMDDMIVWLKNQYDYIIIDTPPAGIVTDGMKCLLMADYPVYIFKANYSKKMFIENFNTLLYENKISKLSLVLNAVDSEFAGYGYGKAYSYGNYREMGFNHGYYEGDDIESPKTIKEKFNGLMKKFNI